MKILILSDIHMQFNKFSPENMRIAEEKPDLILIAGDITNITGRNDAGFNIVKTVREQKEALLWLQRLAEYAHIDYIPGNHDKLEFAKHDIESYYIRNILDGKVNFRGYTIQGMSMCTAYNMPELANIWSNTTSNPIAEEAYYEQFGYADIVVSHCPPSGKLGRLGDSNHIQNDGKNNDIGSKELRRYIETYQPRAVIVGHNHRTGGAEEMIGNTRVVNVATTFKYIEI